MPSADQVPVKASQNHVAISRMVRSRACWAKAVSLSKVIDLRRAGLIRANTASITDMVSAAGFPVMEDEHGPRALADDEVALPMTSLGSGVDIFGPFMDGDAILYGISRRPRSARAAAFVTSREITPQLLGLLGGAVDEGVDRLAAHGPHTAFISGFQPACNLLGRPPFCEAVENEAPQVSVFLDQRFTPPAQLISSGGVKRRVAPAGQPIAR